MLFSMTCFTRKIPTTNAAASLKWLVIVIVNSKSCQIHVIEISHFILDGFSRLVRDAAENQIFDDLRSKEEFEIALGISN